MHKVEQWVEDWSSIFRLKTYLSFRTMIISGMEKDILKTAKRIEYWDRLSTQTDISDNIKQFYNEEKTKDIMKLIQKLQDEKYRLEDEGHKLNTTPQTIVYNDDAQDEGDDKLTDI